MLLDVLDDPGAPRRSRRSGVVIVFDVLCDLIYLLCDLVDVPCDLIDVLAALCWRRSVRTLNRLPFQAYTISSSAMTAVCPPAAAEELLVRALEEELCEVWPCQCRSARAELRVRLAQCGTLKAQEMTGLATRLRAAWSMRLG